MRKEKSLAAWHPFPQEIRCHPEPFLCSLYPQATTSIPAGHKKGEGSSRAFTPSKKTSARKDHLLLGIPFSQKIRCHPEPFLCPLYPQATTIIPAGHKKGEGSSQAFTQSKKPSPSNNHLLLGIHFSKKKIPVSTRRPGCLKPNKGRPSIPKHPRLYQCYSIGNIFFVAEAVAVSSV